MSVTVLNSTAINDARLRDIRRLDDLAPDMGFNESGQRSSVFVSISGIESNPFIVNRAAIYIDGIPFRELINALKRVSHCLSSSFADSTGRNTVISFERSGEVRNTQRTSDLNTLLSKPPQCIAITRGRVKSTFEMVF